MVLTHRSQAGSSSKVSGDSRFVCYFLKKDQARTAIGLTQNAAIGFIHGFIVIDVCHGGFLYRELLTRCSQSRVANWAHLRYELNQFQKTFTVMALG